MLAALLLAAAATPVSAGPTAAKPIAPIRAGERLEWSVSWMGIAAGTAWATTGDLEGAVLFEAGCASAPWLAGLYPIDDHLRSEWRPGVGSRRYVTRFREGGFQQDQEIDLDGDPIVVARRQLFDDGWRAWDDHHDALPAVEDPVSAFYRLREEAGPVGERVRYTVWSGRRPSDVLVWTAAAERLGDVEVLRVEVLAEHGGGDLEPKMTVWLTADADRVPVAAEVRTRAGPVRVALTRRVLP